MDIEITVLAPNGVEYSTSNPDVEILIRNGKNPVMSCYEHGNLCSKCEVKIVSVGVNK